MARLYSFLWLSNIPLYICTASSLPIHLLMNTGRFYILAIINNAAKNIGVQILFCICVFIFIFFRKIAGVELLDCMAVLFLRKHVYC